MQQRCADIEDCKYPSVKALLKGSKYFEGSTVSCRCIERTSVYSAEWDSELKDYFNRWFEGVGLATTILEKLFNLEEINPHELESIVKSIPIKHRKKVIEAIHTYSELKIPQSVVRILIYSDDIYNGFIDITPLGNIDDVVLKPPSWMKSPLYWVTCQKQFTPEKILRPEPKETIECVPYVHIVLKAE